MCGYARLLDRTWSERVCIEWNRKLTCRSDSSIHCSTFQVKRFSLHSIFFFEEDASDPISALWTSSTLFRCVISHWQRTRTSPLASIICLLLSSSSSIAFFSRRSEKEFMYARKIFLKRFFHQEFGNEPCLQSTAIARSHFLEFFLNRSLSQTSHVFVPKSHQLRQYSLSSPTLTRSSRSSSTIGSLGATSKGGGNDGSGKITFHCPKCGDICTHVQSLVCKNASAKTPLRPIDFFLLSYPI